MTDPTPHDFVEQKCWVHAHQTDLDHAALQDCFDRLPGWRQQRCLRLKRPADRAACVVAFSLLQELWQDLHQQELPPVTARGTGQLVFVDGCGWHLSLTHRDGWAAAALAPVPVGIDLIRPMVRPGLVSHIVSSAESLRHDDNDLAWLWTRKEALAKRTGEGIGLDLSRWDSQNQHLTTWTQRATGIMLSIACDAPAVLPHGWEQHL